MAGLRQGIALTHTQTALRALMDRFDVAPRRSLGQHFVVDPNTVRRIAALSEVGAGDHVLEIGAGLGSLTLALTDTGAHVRAVEVDSTLVAALRDVFSATRAHADASVEIVHDDARDMDLSVVLSGADSWKLVANLPYNIATPLVLDLLVKATAIETMVVMMQREPAERLVAPAGSSSRGVPSVLVERHAVARVAAIVGPSVFMPRPKVESALLRIDRRGPTESLPLTTTQEKRFERLLRKAFGNRRKMLRRSLAADVAAEDFEHAGVDPTQRPQSLTLQQWMALACERPTARG